MDQLRQAVAASFPEHCLQMLRKEVTRLEEQDRAARPIGQQIDQARARLSCAVARCERAEATITKAQTELASARGEVTESHTDLAKLMDETTAGPMSTKDMQAAVLTLQRTLMHLAQTVEGTWVCGPGVPPPASLVDALQTTAAVLQQAGAVAGACPANVAAPTLGAEEAPHGQLPQVGVSPEASGDGAQDDDGMQDAQPLG